MLKFLGRGAGFSDKNNGACFSSGSRLILMDCPLITFIRLKNEGISKFASSTGSGDEEIKELIVAVTHTHSDHVGGLAMTIHYATFVLKIHVTVIAPSEEVKQDLDYLLRRLDGCNKDTYSLVTAEEYMRDGGDASAWMKAVIPTKHVPALDGRCFGYNIEVDGVNTVYTGDTSTLDPFIPYLSEGSVLYTECSAYDTSVHMYVDRLIGYSDFFKEKGIRVYLMHLDDEDTILSKVSGTGFEAAELA